MNAPRLNATERRRFNWHSVNGAYPREPAMGTLADRLNILAQRHGMRTGKIVLTKDEAAQVEAARIVPASAPVKRLNANERKVFRAYAGGTDELVPAEPAMGTLADRLAILAQRHGASSARRIVLSGAEREELAGYAMPDRPVGLTVNGPNGPEKVSQAA